MEKLIAQLKRHEGFRAMPYRCTAGYLTIGYGRNIDNVPLSTDEWRVIKANSLDELVSKGIAEPEAESLLILEVQRLHKVLGQKIKWFAELDEVRQAVLINMAFNLGVTGLLKFKNTLTLIRDKAYIKAGHAMLKSLWASQVKGRADELALQMQTGKWRQS